jgi:hypothetical protein
VNLVGTRFIGTWLWVTIAERRNGSAQRPRAIQSPVVCSTGVCGHPAQYAGRRPHHRVAGECLGPLDEDLRLACSIRGVKLRYSPDHRSGLKLLVPIGSRMSFLPSWKRGMRRAGAWRGSRTSISLTNRPRLSRVQIG